MPHTRVVATEAQPVGDRESRVAGTMGAPGADQVRLGLVVYGSLARQTGGNLYDRLLVRALRRWGASVEVVSLPGEPRAEGRALLAALAARFERAPWTALLQDELCHRPLGIVNARLRRRASYPLIAVVHNLGGPRSARSERRYLRSVDGWIANSDDTAAAARRLAGVETPIVLAPPALEHLAPPSDDPVTRAELAARSRAPVVRLLCVANPSPVKGLHLLVPALARLAALPWRLAVAGDLDFDRSYVEGVRRQAAKLGIGGRIDWLGARRGLWLARLYRESHVLVQPSPREGFGLAYLEGLCFGLPVVASTMGAAPELLTDALDARLVDPRDTDGLAAALEALLTRPELRLRLGEAALQRAARYPCQRWSQTAERALELVRRVAGSPFGFGGSSG